MLEIVRAAFRNGGEECKAAAGELQRIIGRLVWARINSN